MQLLLILLSFLLLAAILYPFFKKKKPLWQPPREEQRRLLEGYVTFYHQLSPDEKLRFENSVSNFLGKVRITGTGTTIGDIDRVLVAAAAIIPIFAFPKWEYMHIHEVLIYPGSFTDTFQQSGDERNILGMVGNGPMQDTMILSQHELRRGFLHPEGTGNTAIHEFVHLIDKADGSIDGLPEALLPHPYVLPWLHCIYQEMEKIRKGDSDINPYALTNEQEFLAVVSEYFFKNPHLMKENHPELFQQLQRIFNHS